MAYYERVSNINSPQRARLLWTCNASESKYLEIIGRGHNPYNHVGRDYVDLKHPNPRFTFRGAQ